ncbi:MAG: 50S ribosomal protein L29 [Candidatus Zixiibacteriota bacterium]|nr:MAG: 50S ribosomal protein L29 [candidate division Zixibacteria bacterium]
MKVQTLREMTREELVQKRTELLEEQFNLRMRKSLKSLDNPLRLRQIRREIAKIMTILNEDKIGIRKLADTRISILSQSGAKREDKAK